MEMEGTPGSEAGFGQLYALLIGSVLDLAAMCNDMKLDLCATSSSCSPLWKAFPVLKESMW